MGKASYGFIIGRGYETRFQPYGQYLESHRLLSFRATFPSMCVRPPDFQLNVRQHYSSFEISVRAQSVLFSPFQSGRCPYTEIDVTCSNPTLDHELERAGAEQEEGKEAKGENRLPDV